MGKVSKSVAQPLCSTCDFHEHQARRLNIVWGAGIIIAGAIAPLCIGVLLVLDWRNADAIQATRRVVARNEREVNRYINRIDHTLTVMAINQAKWMDEYGLDYVDPSPMILDEEDYE